MPKKLRDMEDDLAPELPRVGFVVLSHENDGKLSRLIAALDREYDTPPIAIHHDFHQAPLDRSSYRSGILWVEDSLRTGWGKWSVVEGALKAFRLLYDNSDVDWFFHLSAADYPVCPSKRTRAELARASVDAFVDARPLIAGQQAAAEMTGNLNGQLTQFDTAGNRLRARRFYRSPQWWLPIIRFKPRLRVGRWTYRPDIDLNNPFKDGVTCFYGDHWFTANRKAVAALLERSPLNQALQRHYRNRVLPEESYYATLLANTPGLKICLDNRRFAEWNGGGAHPMILTAAQIPDIVASNAYFARKFDGSSSAITEIDAYLVADKQAEPKSAPHQS